MERYTCPGEAHLGDSQNRLAREAGSAWSGGILPDCQACKASLMFPRESFGTVSHLGTDSIIYVDYLWNIIWLGQMCSGEFLGSCSLASKVADRCMGGAEKQNLLLGRWSPRTMREMALWGPQPMSPQAEERDLCSVKSGDLRPLPCSAACWLWGLGQVNFPFLGLILYLKSGSLIPP